MSLVKVINDDGHYQAEMSGAGSKLVVVDFTASWCGPCQRIAPVFDSLSAKYPRALFLKVDVDKCQNTAVSEGVSAMPTFIFFKSKTKLDKVRGADPQVLESKIKQFYGNDDGDSCDVAGHMDLSSFIVKSQCECFNESDQHPFVNTQNTSGSYLESDCDEQLIISISFSQSVKIHSLKIKAPHDKGPKTIKLFLNQSTTMDFDLAESGVPVQEFVLTPNELNGKPINLHFVKFQNVHNIQLFVKDNQSGSETTVIEYLGFIGSPVSTTNMGDFKRITVKKKTLKTFNLLLSFFVPQNLTEKNQFFRNLFPLVLLIHEELKPQSRFCRRSLTVTDLLKYSQCEACNCVRKLSNLC